MKKLTGTRVPALLLALLLTAASLAGCSELKEKLGASKQEEETLYPISVAGREIRVGETKMQTLLDAGYDVTTTNPDDPNDYEQYEVDPETMLEGNAYYSGGTMSLSDSTFAHVSFVTDEQPVKLAEATIARLEFHLNLEETDLLGNISINGVPVTEITREKAEEMFPDFTGDETMWLKYGLTYRYDLNFDSQTGRLRQFAVERKYDVDYTAE